MVMAMSCAGGVMLPAGLAAVKDREGRPAAAVPEAEDGDPPAVLLTHEDQAEVLAFLAARPLHAVIMSGLIRDNGLESPHNRGTFHGVRAPHGGLEGVALIGQVTLFESRTKGALRAIARQTRMRPEAKLILVEDEAVASFWGHFARGKQPPPRFRRELSYELRRSESPGEATESGLRRVTSDDLELVISAHAEMAAGEPGADSLVTDPQGFRERCARRVEQGRVWGLIDHDRLIFKADVVVDTPEALYLEGVYVDPRERGRGIGYRCLSQLGRALLPRAGSVCLLVDEQNCRARKLYEKCGFRRRGCYQSIFLP